MSSSEVRKAEGSEPGESLGDRLAALFKRASAQQGRHVTHQEAADWMTEHGYAVRRAYITQLISGKRKAPSERIVEGLAAFFNVPVSELVEPAATREMRERLERALRDTGVQEIALRSEGLSESAMQTAVEFLGWLRSRDEQERGQAKGPDAD